MGPTLSRLPDCPHRYPRHSDETSIASRGQGFTVASLYVCMDDDDDDETIGRGRGRGSKRSTPYQEVANICYLSYPGYRRSLLEDAEWQVKKLAMPDDDDLEPFQWSSRAAFTHAGRFYWVDYNIGLLSCDVSARSPELRLVKFPVPVRKIMRYSYGDSSHGDHSLVPATPSSRTAGVSGGRIRFVDVDACTGRCVCRHCSQAPEDALIRTWTLRTPEMVWVPDGEVDVGELWETASFREHGLPEWVPQHPVVSLVDPHVVHFVLQAPRSHGRGHGEWLTPVDMKAKSLQSCTEYHHPSGHDIGLLFSTVACGDLRSYLPACK